MSKIKKKKVNVGPKFKLKLVGEDSNAFLLIGLFQRGAIKAGWTKEQKDYALKEMMSLESYDELLVKIMEYADVE